MKCTALNSEAERQKKAKLYEEYVTEEKVRAQVACCCAHEARKRQSQLSELSTWPGCY